MDRSLRPEKLDLESSDQEASKKWSHWKRCFTAYITNIDSTEKPVKKLDFLIQLVSHNIYEMIEEAEDFDAAIVILEAMFSKKINTIYARHILMTRRQKDSETIKEYVASLRALSKDCNFTAVTAILHKEDYIRDALISGLNNMDTKRKILESSETNLEKIISLAQIYEDAKANAESFSPPWRPGPVSCPITDGTLNEDQHPTTAAVNKQYQNSYKRKCGWCGGVSHPRFKCPARNSDCGNCGGKGHWKVVCRNPVPKSVSSSVYPVLASLSKVPKCLEQSVTEIGVCGRSCYALWDTGSAENYVHPSMVERYNLKIIPEAGEVSMANTDQHTTTSGYVETTLTVNGKKYPNIKLTLLENACIDVILGIDFLAKHRQITINYGGREPPLVSALGTLKVKTPQLFANLTDDCHPIASRSRRYTAADRLFIKSEVDRCLREGIIEKSNSPWRAQPYVTGGENQKKRLVIDYSETINRFTLLDAYPLPRIDDTINQIAQYKVFSTIDLKSAYHQIAISDADKPYTAFEAKGGLYQFRRLPFGVTNGVAVFQREMDRFVEENSLKATFPYMDNITICGMDQNDHDKNLHEFQVAAERMNLTYNEEKCEFSTTKLYLLGSVIENGIIRPDPSRLRPLMELAPPTDGKSLKRLLGFFSYYSKWIQNFSMKVSPLVQVDSFPLNQVQLDAFQLLKNEIAESVVAAVEENAPFQLETDASHSALAATLNQSGRPVAFFSRTLRGSELHHSSVEKEAQAIVEAVRYWRYFLTGRHFTLLTDQKSVSFMFDQTHKGKIKNEKIMRWRMDLMCYHFDISYKPGVDNIPPDTFSRGCASVIPNMNKLRDLHVSLAHPGVTRMSHFIKTRNLPFSIEDIRKVNSTCKECAEVKPRYFKPEPAHLIKATQPFERLNLDFKGPLPSTDKNKYFLHVVDEFSRFPFVFPCSDISSQTIIKSLCSMFSMFGMPSYVHSDRGSSFLSHEIRQFLTSRGISCSRTTPYNPEGNGQVEKGNHTIWRATTLALRSKGLPQSCWQEVLPDVLHSVRTLLCTATNCTPHERMFNFHRKSGTGTSLPTWLSNPGIVLLRRFVRHSKQEPLVDEVELLEANPQYAFIRYPDGRESTVSIKDLAPRGQTQEERLGANQREAQEEPLSAASEEPLEDSLPPPSDPVPGKLTQQPVEKGSEADPGELVLNTKHSADERVNPPAPAPVESIPVKRHFTRIIKRSTKRLITEL
jgi:transposase InsO family protein